MDAIEVRGRSIATVAVVLVLACTFGCTASTTGREDGLSAEAPTDGATVCAPHITTLYAGRTIDAGLVTTTNTDTELVVRIDTAGDWRLETIQLYAGTGPVPTNPSGNPVLGHFPYRYSGGLASTMELRVPLAALGVGCDAQIVLALHAELVRLVTGGRVQREGAWAYGDRFLGAQWGWSFGATICCAPDGCTLTQGYWKNHADAWPASTLTLGGEHYDQAALLALLHTPVRGDASIDLAHQLIAAELNAATGAHVDPAVRAALSTAHAWIIEQTDSDGRLPCGVASSSSAGARGVELAGILAAYNEGLTTTPHCDD